MRTPLLLLLAACGAPSRDEVYLNCHAVQSFLCDAASRCTESGAGDGFGARDLWADDACEKQLTNAQPCLQAYDYGPTHDECGDRALGINGFARFRCDELFSAPGMARLPAVCVNQVLIR